jgi:hypothetical protein
MWIRSAVRLEYPIFIFFCLTYFLIFIHVSDMNGTISFDLIRKVHNWCRGPENIMFQVHIAVPFSNTCQNLSNDLMRFITIASDVSMILFIAIYKHWEQLRSYQTLTIRKSL